MITLTDDNLNQDILDSSVPTLLFFNAAWSGSSKMIEPEVTKLDGAYAGRLTIVNIDIDKNPETVRRFGVRGIPISLLFKNGEPIGQMVGASLPELKKLIKDIP